MSGVALKRICELVTEAGPEEERPFVALEHVVGGTGQLEKDTELPSRRPASGLAAVSPGDVLFGKLRPYLNKTLRVQEPMFASTELMALRPAPDVDSRWLHYLLMGDQVMGWAVATSDGSKMPRTSWSDLGELRVAVPELREQRAIADYLDAETARIDALLEKKRLLHSAIEERFRCERDERVRRLMANHGSTKLRRLVDGIEQGWSPTCENREADADAWGVLKTSAVTQGEFRRTENKQLPSDLQADLRWAVKDGDLLIARGSGSIERVGTAAVAAPTGAKLMISDLIYRLLRPHMDTTLLAHCINSSVGRGHLESSIRTDVGQTLKIRGDDILDTPVPWVPPELQTEALDGIEQERSLAKETVQRLKKQTELLTEHRQALITAAVTGELEVAGRRG